MSDERFRLLPSVDELASRIEGAYPRPLVVAECRRAIDERRALLRSGLAEPTSLERQVEARLAALAAPSLQPVLNATGVILHTNLGRAPLPTTPPNEWYSNLEYDLSTGKRGKRDVHTSPLLEKLLGVPALAVNNGAAAVFLILQELAAPGEVLISRGEMIEIGDGFRIPDIMARSGVRLVEVGTTNRTRLEDYRSAITGNTRLIVRVHPSNFRIEGFTGRPSLQELAALAREHAIPLYEDLGSGCLLKLDQIVEPTIAESLAAGVDLVSFSGDKLLGGPQAGLIAGRPALVARLRANPLFRALRLDKLVIEALETTLRHLLLERFDAIPVLNMLRLTPESIRLRAESLAAHLHSATVEPGYSLLGGGSTPEQKIATTLLVLSGNVVALEARLRRSTPPVITRIEKDHLLLDLRTIPASADALLLKLLQQAQNGPES